MSTSQEQFKYNNSNKNSNRGEGNRNSNSSNNSSTGFRGRGGGYSRRGGRGGSHTQSGYDASSSSSSQAAYHSTNKTSSTTHVQQQQPHSHSRSTNYHQQKQPVVDGMVNTVTANAPSSSLNRPPQQPSINNNSNGGSAPYQQPHVVKPTASYQYSNKVPSRLITSSAPPDMMSEDHHHHHHPSHSHHHKVRAMPHKLSTTQARVASSNSTGVTASLKSNLNPTSQPFVPKTATTTTTSAATGSAPPPHQPQPVMFMPYGGMGHPHHPHHMHPMMPSQQQQQPPSTTTATTTIITPPSSIVDIQKPESKRIQIVNPKTGKQVSDLSKSDDEEEESEEEEVVAVKTTPTTTTTTTTTAAAPVSTTKSPVTPLTIDTKSQPMEESDEEEEGMEDDEEEEAEEEDGEEMEDDEEDVSYDGEEEEDDDEGDYDDDASSAFSGSDDEEEKELPPGLRKYTRDNLLAYNTEDVSHRPFGEIENYEIYVKPGENVTAANSTGYLRSKSKTPAYGYGKGGSGMMAGGARHHHHHHHPHHHHQGMRNSNPSSPMSAGGSIRRGGKRSATGVGQSADAIFGTSHGNNNRSKMKGGSKKKGTSRRPKETMDSLHKSENAYKVGQAKDESERIEKDVVGVLNRLTPEKYDLLKNEFLAIPIPSDEVLQKVIDIIFEKAVMEPNFAGLYAQLCKDLAGAGASTTTATTGAAADADASAKEKLAGFKRILLNKCQTEFESEKLSSHEDNSSLTEPEKEAKAMKLRRRKIGNMIFIGELFDKKMLSEKIIHEVIKKLLIENGSNISPNMSQDEARAMCEDDLERLCKLMTTIGKSLDHGKAPSYLNLYFSKMKEFSQNKEFSSRIRFMLLDVIELRQDNWVPRIKTAKAKTIKEVHAEAEKEKKQKEMALKVKGSGGKYYKDDKSSSSGGKMDKKDRSGGMRRSESFDRNGGRKPKNQQQQRYERGSSSSEVRMGQPVIANAWNRQESSNAPPSISTTSSTKNAFSELAETTPTSAMSNVSEDIFDVSSIDTERVQDRTHGVFNTFVEEDMKEDSITEFKSHKFNKDELAYSVRSFITLCIDKQRDMSEFMRLFAALVEDGSITTEAIDRGLKLALQFIIQSELVDDAPMTYKIYGEFIGRCLFEQWITFDQAQQTLSLYVLNNHPTLVLSGSHVIDLLRHLMQTIVQEHDYASDNPLTNSIERLCKSEFNPLRLVNKKRQMMSYSDAIMQDKSDSLDFVAHVVHFVENNYKNDTTADSELLSYINKTIDASLLKSSSAPAKIFSALYVTGEHLKKTTEFVQKTFTKTYGALLRAANGTSAQVALLNEIAFFASTNNDSFTSGSAFESSIKLFVEEAKLISKAALAQWSEQEADTFSAAVACVKHLL